MDNSRSIIDIDVFVNGNQTINQLGKLQAEMSALRNHIKEIPKDNEAFKLLEISAKNLEKTYAKLDGQLKHHIATNELNKKRYQEVEKAIQQHIATGNTDSQLLKQMTKDRDYYNKMMSTSQRHIDSTNLRLQENKNQMQAVNEQLKQTTKHTKEYTDANEKLKLGTQEIKRLQQEVGILGMNKRQLKQLVSELNRELDGVTYGTQAYKDLKAKIQEVSAVIRHQQNDLRDTRTSWQKFKDEMRDFGTATMGNIGGEIAMRAFDGMTQALVGTVTQAAKLSDEIADMQRFTDNTKAGAEELNAELSKVFTRTGTSELRGITMVGGQLGVVKEEVKGFVVEIDKAKVALEKDFNGNAEEVANSIGKIKNLYEETKEMNWQEAIGRIGSAITSAGSISAANAPQISDFVQRIGAIGELGPKLTENLGLGASLLDLGLSSEIASSGLQALFITAGKEAEAFAKQIGISKEEFIKLQNENPNEMLLQVAKSFKGLSNSEVMAGLQRMGITSGETVKVMALLKDNTDKVVNAQTLMRKEFDANTKLTEAFNIKMQTFGAQVDLAKKEINGLVASISTALLPVMTKGIELIVSFVMILKAMPKFLDDNKVAIGSLVVAMLAFNAQAIIAQANIIRTNFNLLTLQITTRAYAIATGLATAAQYALNVALTANPIGLVVAAIALLVGGLSYLYNNSETVRTAIDDLWQSLVRVWDYTKILYEEIKKIDFAKPFENVISTFEQMQASLQKLGTEMLVFLENISGNSESIYDKVSNYIASIFDELSKKVSNSLAEVGKGWVQFGQMYADFGRQIMETGFVESIKQALTEVGKGWVEYGKMYVDTYNQIANYDYQTAMLNFKNSVENSLIAATKTIKNYAQIYLDFTNEILNSSFSENISKALSEVGRGFGAYAKIFTDFGKDVVNTYLGVQKDVENIFNDLADTLKDFVTENFGTELESIQKAWLQFSTAIDEVKTSFDNLTNSISTTFNALSDNTVSRAIEKIKSVFQTSNTLLAEKIARDTGTMPAVGSLLRNPSATQKQNEKHALFPELLPKKTTASTPKQSPEDLALIEENKKRAAALADEEKKKQDEKNDKAKDDFKKLQQEKLAAEKAANQAMQDLRISLMQDEEQKEKEQAKLAAERKLQSHKENLQKGLITSAQFSELEKMQKDELNAQLFEIDNKYRGKSFDADKDARKKSFDEKLKDLENNRKLEEAQAGFNEVSGMADIAAANIDNPEEQARLLAEQDMANKMAALDREKQYKEDELALYREYGELTKAVEADILATQTDIEAKRIAMTQKQFDEKEKLRLKEREQIERGLGMIGNSAGKIAQSLQQLGVQNSAFGKALALTQIAIASGIAIAQSVGLAIDAAKAGGPAAPFLVAGYIATTVATVLGAISQAKQAVESAPTPSPTTTGGGSSRSGESGYFEGGKVRREAAGFTGGSSIYEPIPMIAHGGEYIIPNWLMKTPPVANFVNMVEAVRTGRNSPNSLNTSQNKPQNGFFEGGLNPLPKGEGLGVGSKEEMLMSMMRELMTEMQVIKNTKMKAYVVARDVTEIQNQENQLDNDAML